MKIPNGLYDMFHIVICNAFVYTMEVVNMDKIF